MNILTILRSIQKGMHGCASFPRCGHCTGIDGHCSVVNNCINDIRAQFAGISVPAPATKETSTKAPDPRKATEKPAKPGKNQSPALMAKTARKPAGKK